MKIGMNLPIMVPGLDRDTVHAWCRAIDEGPFSSLAVGERINFPNPELTVTLSMAAAWTSRVRLLYNVLVLPMHDEVLIAKQIATLDVLSGGRVDVAVGVGGREEDYAAVSATWDKKRLAKLERQVGRMRRIWAGEKAVPTALRPVEPFPTRAGGPEILSGSLFPLSIERAARFADGVCSFSFGASNVELEGGLNAVRNAWKAAGRETAPRFVSGTWFALGDTGRAQMDGYLERYLNFMGDAAEFMIPQAKITDAASLRDALARARDLGIDEFVLAPTTSDVSELSRLLDVIA